VSKHYPWGDERRYNAFSARIRERFGGRIQKVSINAGFTCPNRDGKKGWGGCIYCNNESFTPSYCVEENSLPEQINMGINFLSKRYKRSAKYFAYFQSYSNTYKPLAELKSLYRAALSHPMISGLVISTRPDCVDEKILDYLTELNEKVPVFIEYGIESCYDKTLVFINRGHRLQDTIDSIHQTAVRGLHTTGHLIFGLPGETEEMMLNEASILSSLPINSLKFHQLQIIRNTTLGYLYSENPEVFSFFSLDKYVEFIIHFIERLNPKISIDRVAGESPPRHRLNPGWGNKRVDWVQKKIESVMESQDTWQGKKFN
jgi:radical SAM protein (TIGR01212 family)